VRGNEPTPQPAPGSLPLFQEYLAKAQSYLPQLALRFPNGLTRGFDNLLYLPSSADGIIRVYAVSSTNSLHLVDTIRTGMPLDNIAPDAHGDLYVAGFPDLRKVMKAMADPRNVDAPSTLLRIRKTVDVERKKVEYRVEKVLEDREGRVVSGATTVRHDVRTGRLWIGGKFSLIYLFGWGMGGDEIGRDLLT
jgi:hypothetical protein